MAQPSAEFKLNFIRIFWSEKLVKLCSGLNIFIEKAD